MLQTLVDNVHIYEWERDASFHPGTIQRRVLSPTYVNVMGEQVQGKPTYSFCGNQRDFAETVLESNMCFLDTSYFIAGNVHNNVDLWEEIILDKQSEAFDWIKNKVDINKFMTHFKGEFNGVVYDHSYPPPRIFRNAPNCKQFVSFINSELAERLKSGAISYVGKVGEVQPPHVVSGITIEPTKPRLCINLMYVNCFMKETPFTLDSLTDIPRITKQGDYLSKVDDHKGYNNVFMSENSRSLLGFQWGGHYFVCNTVPFGWRCSAYVYNSLNLHAVSHLRRQSVSSLLYIDDRLVGEYGGEVPKNLDDSYSRSQIAIHWAVRLFVCLGYYLNLSKSVFIPTQLLIFLGMWVDTVKRSFFVTDKRKAKLKRMRETILRGTVTSVLTLQKFTGICCSMILAIRASKLYTTACNRAISRATRNNELIIPVCGELRDEVEYWNFLDTWTQPFPWLSESHISLQIASDSSEYKWGAVYKSADDERSFSDFWSQDQLSFPIMVKEALALKNALNSLGTVLTGKRIMAFVDNKSVVFAWSNQTSRNSQLNTVLKEIFQFTLQYNCALEVTYIPSKSNPSDLPSRTLSKADATITSRTWLLIQSQFGPHTVDMFSLDSNAMTDLGGNKLRHFTPFPSPLSFGVDALAQPYSATERYYAFPPFCLLPGLVKFIIDKAVNATLVFPWFDLLEPWHVLILRSARSIITVGYKHDKGVLLYPTKKGYQKDKRGLQWTLMAANFQFPKSAPVSHICSHLSGRRPANHVPVLFVGDSMIRFMTGMYEDTHVISIGGAKLLDSLECLRLELSRLDVFLVIFHAGTNNVNKAYYPEASQLDKASQSLVQLEKSVLELQKKHRFGFVFSSCIYTRSRLINKRIDTLNALIKQLCNRCSFKYIDNSNISPDLLKDQVHLSTPGEKTFLGNLSELL